VSRITVNGRTIDVQGSNISVINGVIKVDGKVVESGLTGTVKLEWQGDLASLHSDGDVTCGNVSGNVEAGGSVRCGDVAKNVAAGGSVQCGTVNGNLAAGGSVRITK
jgi:hypothetical protein